MKGAKMNIPKTEQRNPDSTHLDVMSTEEMARLVITANYDAVRAVEAARAEIAAAIDAASFLYWSVKLSSSP